MKDSGLVVNRWRRYGKDRLYVQTPEGGKVGFWDLVTATAHVESPELEPALLMAVAQWRASEQAPGASEVAEAADTVAPVDAVVASAEPVRPWVDLATNAAGAEARERAHAHRDSAPVRTVLARVLGVHTDERAWRIGADGEEKVAAQLAKVSAKDPRWRFLHAIPVGTRGSDIDHVVIGPGGVFTANAKHHPGAKIWVGGSTVMVNGVKQPYVRNARHEAQRAATLLTKACGFAVHVEGLVVTVNANDVVVKSQPDGVSVIPRMQVARWLLRHGDILELEAVDAIYEMARRSTTWR